MKILKVLCIVILIPSQAFADTISIAALEFCPYVCSTSEHSSKMGFVFDIEKAIFEKHGHQVNFHIVPYARSLKGTEQGKYDAVGIANDHSSLVNICSKESIGAMTYSFYVKKGNSWRYNGLESVKQVRLGTISGYNYTLVSPEFQHYIETANSDAVQVYYGKESLIKRMLKGITLNRIDTFSEASYVADYVLNEFHLNDYFERAGHFPTIFYGKICFSPKNPKAQVYADLVDLEMKQLRASGELQKIMDRYGLQVWE